MERTPPSSLVWMRGREHCSSHSGPLAGVPFSIWSRTCSGFCCFAVFACLSLPQFSGRHQGLFWPPSRSVRRGGGWPDEGRLRLQPPRCIEKAAQGSHPTSWSAIWTCLHHGKHSMAEDWKLWPKVFQSLGACSWRSTRRWSVHSTATEWPDAVGPHSRALCRRLRLPMPLSSCTCQCGRLLGDTPFRPI